MTTVYFDTAEYQRSHGKAPRGTGCWAFFVEGDADPYFAPGTVSYSDAKAWMKGKVASMGYKRAVTVTVGP